MSHESVESMDSGSAVGAAGRDLEWLQEAVAESASSPLFPALVETYRQLGDLVEARRVAEAGLDEVPESTTGRVALALTLLDLGEIEAVRDQLTGALRSLQVTPSSLPEAGSEAVAEPEALSDEESAPPPAWADDSAELEPSFAPAEDPDAGLEDAEIDQAFESAEAQPDEMVDANKVVEQTLRREELDAPEGEFASLSSTPTFATRTVAELLERQGDREGADAIRSSLGSLTGDELDAAEVPEEEAPSDGISGADPAETVRIVATLQSWLENLRRGVA